MYAIGLGQSLLYRRRPRTYWPKRPPAICRGLSYLREQQDRATIRHKKTGRPVRFELPAQTRLAIDDYLRETGRKAGDFLFAGRAGKGGLTKIESRVRYLGIEVDDAIEIAEKIDI